MVIFCENRPSKDAGVFSISCRYGSFKARSQPWPLPVASPFTVYPAPLLLGSPAKGNQPCHREGLLKGIDPPDPASSSYFYLASPSGLGSARSAQANRLQAMTFFAL